MVIELLLIQAIGTADNLQSAPLSVLRRVKRVTICVKSLLHD